VRVGLISTASAAIRPQDGGGKKLFPPAVADSMELARGVARGEWQRQLDRDFEQMARNWKAMQN
jgi:hypothetical protein